MPLPHCQCKDVRFVNFFSAGFITAIVVNPPERRLAKRTSVQCLGLFRRIKYRIQDGSYSWFLVGTDSLNGLKSSPKTCVHTTCLLWCNAACLDVQSFYSRLHIQDCINSRYNGVAQFQESIAKLLRYVSEYSLIQPNNSVYWGFIRYLIGST